MVSPFRAAAAAHAAAVDSVFGERLRIEPQIAAGRMVAGGADPARELRVVTGTVTRRVEVLKRQGAGSEGADNVRINDARWLVGFDARLGLVLRPGDHVVRLDDPPPGEPVRLRLGEATPIPGRALHPADEV